MALRIVVECLARLKRLDDVERIVLENLEKEVTTIRQHQQARTFSRLEDNSAPQSIRSAGKTLDLTDFRRHLTELLAAFGCVYLRLSHLAQILRWRIVRLYSRFTRRVLVLFISHLTFASLLL